MIQIKNRSLIWHQCLLVILCGLLFLPFLGSPVLFDFDEAYFASIAREMHEKGDWIVPTINDSSLGDKPILIFWGMLVSFSVFGVSEFSVRFPTVCWNIGAVLLTYHLARRLFHNRVLALRSAFILATMLLFCAHARVTTCDMAMICWILAATTVYVYGTSGFREDFKESPAQTLTERLVPWYPQNGWVVVLMYACLGVATLAKGPVPPILATAVIGLFLLVKGFRGHVDCNPLKWVVAFGKTCLLMRPFLAVGVVLIVAGPWFLAVGYKTGWEWTKLFFYVHNFERTISPIRGHTGFPLYYLFMTLLGTFPWSIFFVPCSIDLVRRLRRGIGPVNTFQFLLCWIILYFVLFSFVTTKLPHYVMPAYPAIAMLIGSWLFHWRRGEDLAGNFWTPVVIGTLYVIGAGTLMTLLVLAPKYFPDEQSTALLLGLFPLLTGIVAAIVYRLKGRKSLDLVYVIFAVCFVPLLFQYTAVRISRYAHYRNDFFQPVVEFAAAHADAPPLLIGINSSDPTSTFYSGQPIRTINLSVLSAWKSSGEEPANLVKRLREKLIAQDEERPKNFPQKIDRRLKEGQIFLVMEEKEYNVIQPLC
ncbi:MAG: glycosyltransferase family 39 protein, partial [Planctomycetaceae bacterium]|nr:glycosyltransferase family 39 protein [Planctomycetaceae bacterium]